MGISFSQLDIKKLVVLAETLKLLDEFSVLNSAAYTMADAVLAANR